MNLEIIFKPTEDNPQCTARWFFEVEKFKIGKKRVGVKIAGEHWQYFDKDSVQGAYQWWKVV